MKSVRFFAVLALSTLLIACGTKKHPTLPEELVGVWKTSAPKYADRYFELQRNTIIFGTGEGTTSTHLIDSVEEARKGDQILYTISYTEDGKRYEWSFYYDPAHSKSIRLKNQAPMVWTKKGDS
jgi:hypothetical protein